MIEPGCKQVYLWSGPFGAQKIEHLLIGTTLFGSPDCVWKASLLAHTSDMECVWPSGQFPWDGTRIGASKGGHTESLTSYLPAC